MNWTPLTTPPTKSGTYIVGHRGHQETMKFLQVDSPSGNTRVGWQGDPRRFRATHWAEISRVPDHDEPRDGHAEYYKGRIIRVTANCLAAIYEQKCYGTYVPCKWGPFKFNRRKNVKIDGTKGFVPVSKGTLGVVLRSAEINGKWTVWVILNDSGREVVFNETIGYNFESYKAEDTHGE